MTLDTVVVKTKDHLSSNLGGEEVILDLSSGTYYGLDEVGARIWTLIGEPSTIQDVCDQLIAEYNAEQSVIERDALRFLEKLDDEGLIQRLDEE